MNIKDYYKILELPPHASMREVKQSYRRLAMIYHPDKNNNDKTAAALFSEVKEAYEVLTNPAKKEFYLQQKWYNDSIGKKKTQLTITPVNVLKESLELERYVSTLDVHRMNQEGLYEYIKELLNDDTINKLHEFNDEGVNRQIVSTMLAAIKPLDHQFISNLSLNLEKLSRGDKASIERINQLRHTSKKNFLWERYKIIVILIITVLICVLIFITSK